MCTLAIASNLLSYCITLTADVFIVISKLPKRREFVGRREDCLALPIYDPLAFVKELAKREIVSTSETDLIFIEPFDSALELAFDLIGYSNPYGMAQRFTAGTQPTRLWHVLALCYAPFSTPAALIERRKEGVLSASPLEVASEVLVDRSLCEGNLATRLGNLIDLRTPFMRIEQVLVAIVVQKRGE
jgi:hypothetical protein